MEGGAPTSSAHQHAGRSAAGIVVPRIANGARVVMALTIADPAARCASPTTPEPRLCTFMAIEDENRKVR